MHPVMMQTVRVLSVLQLCIAAVYAADNGLGLTPVGSALEYMYQAGLRRLE